MIVVTIGGVDRTAELSDLTITDNVNNQVDICDFTVEKTPASSYVPELNAEIIITRDGVRIFAGTITSVSDQLADSNTIRYSVSCTDYTFDLDRKLVTKRYEDTTINDIIDDLLTTYAPTFTMNNVAADIEIGSIAFNRIKLSECLRKLADVVNYQWYVDYHKDVHFFPVNAEEAPFSASEGHFVRDSLTITKDITQLRNIVLVQGGDEPAAERTVKLAGNGETAEFGTQLKFATKPTVTVDGVTQTVGVDFLDDEASFDALWNFNEKYIRFTPGNLPPKPTAPAETNIEITGTPLFPIVVNVPEPDSIDEYGEREYVITDENITSQQQAIDRALAELRAFAGTINEGSFETYRAGLRSGQTIRVTDTLRGIDEYFVIQRVQYRWLSTDSTYDALWNVTLATRKMIGIIAVLQKLLGQETISQDEQLKLVEYIRIAGDSLTTGDTMSSITTQTGPYAVGTAVVGFSKMN